MIMWDYFVGFAREPEGLEEFLDKQGYDRISVEEGGSSDGSYESRKGNLVNIFYFPKLPELGGDEVPDWKGNGHNVVCELMVSTEDPCAIQKSENMARRLVKKYGGVLYDIQFEEFLTKKQI
jgi:hypothetical protein